MNTEPQAGNYVIAGIVIFGVILLIYETFINKKDNEKSELIQIIKEEVIKIIAESKYDFMIGSAIQFNGVDYIINSVEDDLVNVMDSKKNKKTFRLSAVVAQNPGVDVKPKKPRPAAWNKGMKSDAYSPQEYQRILKGAISDAGGNEYAHDMAQSMIYDPGIRARIEKDYPMLRSTKQLIQRLQWDLEAYS